MIRKRSARDPQLTRQALLDAASALFAERGFDGATADLIAARARVNKAMINYHFRTKRGLYEAALIAPLDVLAGKLAELRARALPAPELLREFVATFVRFGAENPRFPAMLLREVVSGGERLGKPVSTRLLGVFGFVREMTETGARQGAFRDVNPVLVHQGMIGSLVLFLAATPVRERLLDRANAGVELPTVEDFIGFMQHVWTCGLKK